MMPPLTAPLAKAAHGGIPEDDLRRHVQAGGETCVLSRSQKAHPARGIVKSECIYNGFLV